MSKEFLRRLSLFAGLSEPDLDRLYSMAETMTVPSGQFLMREGDMGDALYVILDGRFEITKHAGNQDIVLAVRSSGDVIGEMSLLEQEPRNASIRALDEGHVIRIDQATFMQLLSWSPSATLSIMHTFVKRQRSNECLMQQHEKMASLGTLTAGLAHELNNPAAALKRSSPQLRDTLAEWQQLTVEFVALCLDSNQTQKIGELRDEMSKRAGNVPVLDPLTRSDLENELQTWLEERDIEDAWELAPMLVAGGWTVESLAEPTEPFTPAQLEIVLHWLGLGSSVYALLDEVGKSAGRISEIVQAVKTYSFLDQAPIQMIDVHEGLENTLVILRHKLKQGIEVVREFDQDLPEIEAYGSELNQVWTNIIDNAIDAMNGQGRIVLRTSRNPDGKQVVVEICDNGPGIPANVQSRIFDPFFTTKEMGKGTGLGLHISYNIVNDKHKGRIEVDSKPGSTCFRVTLPVTLA